MITKRFIAGAVCPSCGIQDTVQLFERKGRDVRECVDCDFSDEIRDEPAWWESSLRLESPTKKARMMR